MPIRDHRARRFDAEVNEIAPPRQYHRAIARGLADAHDHAPGVRLALESRQGIGASPIRVGAAVVLIELEVRAGFWIDEERQLVEWTLTRVLHHRPHGNDRSRAHEERQAIERRVQSDAGWPLVARARPEVVPDAARQIDGPRGGALARHRRHEKIVTPEKLMAELPYARIVRVVEDERPHQGKPLRQGLPRQRVRVGEEAIAQLGVAAADLLDGGAMRPWHVLAPHPAV